MNKKHSYIAVLIITVIIILLIYFTCTSNPNDIRRRQMITFVSAEKKMNEYMDTYTNITGLRQTVFSAEENTAFHEMMYGLDIICNSYGYRGGLDEYSFFAQQIVDEPELRQLYQEVCASNNINSIAPFFGSNSVLPSALQREE